jgi:hypothetical protein
MPPVSAAAIEIPYLEEQTGAAPDDTAPPASESDRYQPRFRVVTRKPLPRPKPARAPSRANRAFALAGIPAALLVVYVMFWALAIRGGFTIDDLNRKIAEEKIVYAEQLAQKHALQAPGQILGTARAMGFKPGEVQRAKVPASAVAAKEQ